MKYRSLREILGSPLARRLLRDLALFGLIAIVLLTAIRLYYAHEQLRGELESNLDDIHTSHVSALTQSLWTTNETEIALQLHGIVTAPFIEYAAIVDGDNVLFESGRRISKATVEEKIPLVHQQQGRAHPLGNLVVVASLDAVYHRLAEVAVDILISNTAAILALALITFIVFYREVTRHLLATTVYLRNFDVAHPAPALQLARQTPAKPDELDELVAALNAMQAGTREALHSLNASEERFRFALQGANDGLWDWDLNTNRVYFSPRWKAMLGYAEHELENVFATWERLTHPQDLPKTTAILQEYLNRRREKYEVEFRMQHKDGHWVHILARGTVARSDSGEPLRMAGTHVDISERNAANQLIVRERVRLKAILKTASDGIHILDSDGTLLDASTSFLAMLGRDETCLGHLNVADWDPAITRETVRLAIANVLARNEAQIFEARHRHRDGHEFDVEISARGFTIDGQALVYASSRDISARKLAENEREQLQGQLRQAQKMETIGQLTGGIAHDFNNILASILGYTGLAQDRYGDALPDKVKNYLAEVQRAGERGRDLVAKMLAFARSQKGLPQVVALKSLAGDVVNMLASVIPSGIHITLHVAEDDALVQADPVMLQDAITNLIINARDALGDRGSIDIAVRRKTVASLRCDSCHSELSGEFLELSVSDTGCGIAAEHLSRVFDPFYTTKGPDKGTGLGLSMVHGVVHDAGGHIQVASTSGTGTRFSLLLPLAAGSIQPPSDPTPITTREPLAKTDKTILVVDDEEPIAQYLVELLGLHGYRAQMFTSSSTALSAFRAAPGSFAALVTDFTMPGLSGAELTRAILAVTPELPVILCTGFSDTFDARSAAAIGIRRYFDKPVKSSALIAALGELT